MSDAAAAAARRRQRILQAAGTRVVQPGGGDPSSSAEAAAAAEGADAGAGEGLSSTAIGSSGGSNRARARRLQSRKIAGLEGE